jgi:hypothetical protein
VLNFYQDGLIILLATGASLLFWWVLQRIWPKELRRQHNDLIGWQLSILGTTYAVIIGFMLYAVWTNFEQADVNAETEANNLVSLYKLADGMPADQRGKVQALSRAYVDAVLNHDWPNMDQGIQDFSDSHKVIEGLWADLLPVEADTKTYSILYDHALTELRALTEHRRLRELESVSHLPGILWVVLIAGAAITIMSSCMFGADNGTLHAFQVVSLTLLLTLVLVAIADINRPFQGKVHVEPLGFNKAWATMHEGEAGR